MILVAAMPRCARGRQGPALRHPGLADGRALQPSPQRKPEQIPAGRGPRHHEYFVQWLRDNSPSHENAEEGHFAAGAAHLANMACRRGRRMAWDLRTSRAFET